MNKKQEKNKKELKKKKTLALKEAKGDVCEEDKDVAYITKIFIKVMRRNRGFQRRGNSRISTTRNVLCHKCRKTDHFIKDCLRNKVEHKDYRRGGPN